MFICRYPHRLELPKCLAFQSSTGFSINLDGEVLGLSATPDCDVTCNVHSCVEVGSISFNSCVLHRILNVRSVVYFYAGVLFT